MVATAHSVANRSVDLGMGTVNNTMRDMVDITAPRVVEVEIRNDKKVLWINIDGVCALRACRIGELVIINHSELPPIPHPEGRAIKTDDEPNKS